jgi:hypothetical protein
MVRRNTPEQKNRFVVAQAKAMQAARAKRERRPGRTAPAPAAKSHVEVAAEDSAAQAAAAVDPANAPDADVFDPGDHTVADVVAHVEKHPEELEAVLDAELAGKARAGVLSLGD